MRHSLVSIAATLALLAASNVQAQAYVGGNVGWGRIGVDCADAAACDKTATGYKAYGGYHWPNHLAVELV